MNVLKRRLSGLIGTCKQEKILLILTGKPNQPVYVFGSYLAVICQRREVMSTSTVYCEGKTGEVKDIEDVPQSKLFSFLKLVKTEELSDMEKFIHQRHVEALKKKEGVYIDPATGYDVLTRLAHLRRGSCCGNACRHCPYGQASVTNSKLKKKYNTAFYI